MLETHVREIEGTLYDVSSLFNKVFDNLEEYGFEDVTSQGDDCIWYDHLHPSSAMQNVIAGDFAEFLSS